MLGSAWRNCADDRHRARNLQVMMPGGFGGTAPGTDPLGALLYNEKRRRASD